MEIFQNDNDNYQKWIKSNLNGFVINTKPAKGHGYRVAHKTSCPHIVGLINPTLSTKQYIKICGNDTNEIINWFRVNKLNFDGTFKECGKCTPNINVHIDNTSIIYDDEISSTNDFYEGATKQILVNAHERNLKARNKCLEHYGYDCTVCGFNFEQQYGNIGRKFIHVHHIKPISEIGKKYRVDPIKDLIPVCPNCHAMIHSGGELLSIEELRSILK